MGVGGGGVGLAGGVTATYEKYNGTTDIRNWSSIDNFQRPNSIWYILYGLLRI